MYDLLNERVGNVTLTTLMTLIARLLVQMVTSVEHFLVEKPAAIKI